MLLNCLDCDTGVPTDRTRRLGLVVVRGTQVSLVAPQEGVEEISNPFLPADDDDEETNRHAIKESDFRGIPPVVGDDPWTDQPLE